MQYQGGKGKLARHIVAQIENVRRSRTVIEPFAGAFNITAALSGPRWANDADPRMVDLFQALLEGWTPPENVSEELYYDVKRNPQNHHPAMQAFVGCGCSFGGKWWGGPARCAEGKSYAAVAKRSLAKKVAKLQGVRITCQSYDAMELPSPSECILYCDPPYGDTQGYDGKKFDSSAFWGWCESKAAEGYDLLVSEYSCPVSWPVLWEKPWKTSLSGSWAIKDRVERLYGKGPSLCNN